MFTYYIVTFSKPQTNKKENRYKSFVQNFIYEFKNIDGDKGTGYIFFFFCLLVPYKGSHITYAIYSTYKPCENILFFLSLLNKKIVNVVRREKSNVIPLKREMAENLLSLTRNKK